MKQPSNPKVWFVGAGPGAADLITVRGRELIEHADAILYAGSLVNREHLTFAPKSCACSDSSGMTRHEIIDWLLKRALQMKQVVRLQTGDPTLYGALMEIALPLEDAGVSVSVVPGISSAMASAATAVETLTLPETTQTVIFTRTGVKTPMPKGEELRALARHRVTFCIFLSATLMTHVSESLCNAGWPQNHPALVVHKASWPGEEQILRCRLDNMAHLCQRADITGQAMIIIGPTLYTRQDRQNSFMMSRLYDPTFSHQFRKASL